jgi:alpha-mannosidase
LQKEVWVKIKETISKPTKLSASDLARADGAKTSHATLHMIGNAHIDPVWLWRWQEGCHEVLASFRSALDRMGEDQDFIFVSSSAAFYQWVEQIEPAMFEEIRARVREGRWEIVSGWWIQPDCNIPGGESFVRQGLYGQHYFKEKFGESSGDQPAALELQCRGRLRASRVKTFRIPRDPSQPVVEVNMLEWE